MSLLLLLLTSLLLYPIAQGYTRKRKSKYPFYRPQYDLTQSLFKPFTDVLSNGSIANNKEELYNYLINAIPPFISYHNYTQYINEINHIIKLTKSTISPWFPIISMNEESKSVDGNPLHRITLTNKAINNENKIKILMIFGEHPREFIVNESMFDLLINILLSYIYSKSDSVFETKYVNTILNNFEIDIIPILNPDGKISLENTGDYCWRWNSQSHQVDLNRNFDWKFGGKRGSTHKKGTEEWHGTKAFSEPEAEFLHSLLVNNNYTVVLDIHSGTQQIFVPFVDTESRRIKRTRPETNEEIHLVKYIQLNSHKYYKNSGIAWKYNDYGADGTILDYVGGVAHVPYSLCAEIYGDPNVDNSIDCFVQFNPDNGDKFAESMNGIRALYTGTFDYFLTPEKRLVNKMMETATLLRNRLLEITKQ